MQISVKRWRIYKNFIRECQGKELPLVYEVHHIVPKALSGTDDESNLIALSCQDHFIAHVLLAKACKIKSNYWYRMNFALSAFLMDKDRRQLAPEQVGAAREAAILAKTGQKPHNLDKKVYNFFNRYTKEVLKCTRKQMVEMFGYNRARIHEIITGKRGSYLGWIVIFNFKKHETYD